MEQLLFVNACVRGNRSRSLKLARRFLEGWQKAHPDGAITEVDLCKDRPVPQYTEVLAERDELWAAGRLDHPMFDLARQFAEADTLVIAAPFWDLSFPASLRQYLEQVNVPGITFRYTEEGIPVSLCRARRLYYVTTAGGYYFPEEYGYGYVKVLPENFYGISDVRLIRAAGLDIEGIDAEQILRECMENLKLTEQTFIE